MTDPQYIVLPAPISLNNAYANVPGKGRVPTAEFRAWKRRADELLRLQPKAHRFSVPVEITYFVGEVGVGSMDIGNTEKAFSDSLVRAGIIKDDSRKWVRSIRSVWVPGMAGCVAAVEPATDPIPASLVLSKVPNGWLEALR